MAPVAPTDLLAHAQEKLKTSAFQLLNQEALISRLMAEPYRFGTIVDMQNSRVSLDLFEVNDLATIIDPSHENSGQVVRLVGVPDGDGYVRCRISIPTASEDEEQDLKIVEKFDSLSTGISSEYPAQIKLVSKDDGSFILVQTNDDKLIQVKSNPSLDLEPGQVVRLNSSSSQIIGIIDFVIPGEIHSVRSVLSNGLAEVDYMSSVRVVYPAKYKGDIVVGDRVLLDVTNRVIIQRLTSDVEGGYRAEMQKVEAKDIVGCQEAISVIDEAVIYPTIYASYYQAYNKKPIKGILLSGPPGVGKTTLGHYAHTQLAKHHGVEKGDSGFIYVKGPEILRSFVGASEAEVRSLFARGARHFSLHNYPAILFIDEADAIFPRRGSGISTDVNNTIVTTFLSEMSGLNASNVVIVLATNHPETIDSAVLRDGRIDRHVHVARPGIDDLAALFELYAKKVPLDPKLNVVNVAARITAEITSSSLMIMNVTTPGRDVPPFCLRDCVSGAMIANLVDRATTNAIKRELITKVKAGGGVNLDDLLKAVQQTYNANLGINHDINLRDYANKHDVNLSQATVEKVSKQR